MEFKGNKINRGKWFQSHRKGRDGYSNTEIYGEDGETIATMAWCPLKVSDTKTISLRKENAELIVKAVNSYDKMLQMLQQIADDLENGDTPPVYIIHELIKEATTI